MRIIESLQNRALREARKLKQKKFRQAKQQFCLEGVRLVTTALQGNARVREAFVTQEIIESPDGSKVLGALESAGAEVNRVPSAALRTLAETASPQGIVAVVQNVLVPVTQLTLRRHPVLLVLQPLLVHQHFMSMM